MTTKTNTSTIIAAINAAGSPLPKKVAKALEENTLIRRTAQEWGAGYKQVVRAWTEAVVKGTDPLDDKTFQKLILSNLLSGDTLRIHATNVADERVVEAITDSVDEILPTLKKAVDTAGKTLTAAYGILGDITLGEALAVFRLGAKAVDAHTQAIEAANLINRIDRAWNPLVELTMFADPSTLWVDRLAETDLTTYDTLRRGMAPRPWALVQAGATIDYAIDAATVNARAERHAQERAAEGQSKKSAPNYATFTASRQRQDAVELV